MSRIATNTLLAAALAALVAGCQTHEDVSPAATQSPPSPQSPSPGSHAGQVGDKFTVESSEARYEVTLLSLDQQAQPDSEYSSIQAGHHLAAAQFRVTAITSTDENANNSATVTGTNDQAYTSSLSGVAAGTNFANGSIRLQPGSSLVGWVSFELPSGVQVARVRWTPGSGFSPHSEEWLVSGTTPASPGSTSTATPTGTSSPGTATPSPGTTTPGQTTSPEQVVIAYFDAINARNYQKAWDLGGKNTTSSFSSFVSGFSTTSMVSVDILNLSGDPSAGVVTARVSTVETDGSTKVYAGTYTVRNGVIDEFSVHQVS